MPSHNPAIVCFIRKEWRELLASRSWWTLLLLIGPLVGVTFIRAVQTYAEASGLNGTAAGVGEAFSPLIGIWAPTFSACELAAVFLLPFVAIHQIAADRSGALAIEVQHQASTAVRLSAKVLVLLGGWALASAAPLSALVLWRSYGGHVYWPELAAVLVGHTLNAALAMALAAAAAAVVQAPSTAAILTLAATIGNWIISFVAALRGGVWERIAAYTPTAVVAEFQHGLVRLDALLVVASLVVGFLGVAAIWMRPGMPARRRAGNVCVVVMVTTVVVAVGAQARRSWDLSEDRHNSFARADERALKQIHAPLKIVAHLAPEDPRRLDLERRSLSKLRRLLPTVDVQYVSATSIGLFEQTSAHYGEIWYELEGRQAMSRVTTSEGVVETISALAGVEPVSVADDPLFRGHPLARTPRYAAVTFFGLWPAVVGAGFIVSGRRS